jgi:hypothetical protein
MIESNAAYEIIELASWALAERDNGNRAKANKINKIAENWYIRRFGVNAAFDKIFVKETFRRQ